MDFVGCGWCVDPVDVLGLRLDGKARAMNKAEAIDQLTQLRWAIDALPDEATILTFESSNVGNKRPRLHSDRTSVCNGGLVTATTRSDSEYIKRFRYSHDVEVYCLVKSPLPEGV